MRARVVGPAAASSGPDIIRVYTLGRLSRGDRERVSEAVDLFHSNPLIQRECRQIRDNAAQYLTHVRTSGLGSGYKASCDIPAGTRIVMYTGVIKPASARLGNHEFALGEHFASVPLVIDGAPPLNTGDVPPLGLMQVVNHACPPRANCLVDDDAELTCDVTGLPLLVLRTARIIQADEGLFFSYQLRVTATSFWRLEASLPSPSRGWLRVRCLCAAPAVCPNGLARNEQRRPVQPSGHRAVPSFLPPPPPNLSLIHI